MTRKRNGISALELVVVVGIVGVLLTLTASAILRAKETARDLQCVNNLQQIGVALHQFSAANNGAMPIQLLPALEPFVENNPNIWICPNDADVAPVNSYASLYVPRENFELIDGAEMLIRCPRHPEEGGGIVLLADRTTHGDAKGTLLNEGVLYSTLPIGTTLPDGSQVEGSNIMIIMARREGSLNRWHIVLAIPGSGKGSFKVTKGSRFEVLTPAGLAAVEGTEFQVSSTGNGSMGYRTTVNVYEGVVRVRAWNEPGQGKRLIAGQSRNILVPIAYCWPTGN